MKKILALIFLTAGCATCPQPEPYPYNTEFEDFCLQEHKYLFEIDDCLTAQDENGKICSLDFGTPFSDCYNRLVAGAEKADLHLEYAAKQVQMRERYTCPKKQINGSGL